MKQLNREEALAIYNNKAWENWSDEEIVKFQLYQDRLAIPFDRFHKAIEKVLGRPVWTHEFAIVDLLRLEFEGVRKKPTLAEIMGQIPKEKLILVVAPSIKGKRKE